MWIFNLNSKQCEQISELRTKKTKTNDTQSPNGASYQKRGCPIENDFVEASSDVVKAAV